MYQNGFQPLLDISGDLVLRRHVVVEPDEAKNDAHCFGDALVEDEGHRFVQRDFDHLDQFSLLGFTSSLSYAMLVGHLGVKHGLLGSGHTDARPVGEDTEAFQTTRGCRNLNTFEMHEA